MPKINYFAICPDGSEVKRSSAGRIYTHVVVGRRSYLEALMQAKQLLDVDRKNFEFSKVMASGAVYNSRGMALQAKDAADRQRYQDSLLGCETAGEYQAKLLEKRVARVEEALAGGFYDSWGYLGWCGRHDLALKLAAKERGPFFAEVAILEAQRR